MIGIGWCYVPDVEKDVLEMLQSMQEQDFVDVKGYDIYFETNPGMEEYMLNHGRSISGERTQSHTVLTDMKETLNPEEKAKKNRNKLKDYIERIQIPPAKAVQILNVVSLCILIICCIIAVTTMNQYDKMKQMEKSITCLEISMDEQKNLPGE